MISAKPDLAGQFEVVAASLKSTALDHVDMTCGGDADGDPNNVYGEGRIDALAAVDLVKSGGILAGTVRDAINSHPIAAARITADNGERQFTAVTDGSGQYELFLAAGTYTVTAEAFGYEQGFAENVEIIADEVTHRSFDLARLPRFIVSGVVKAAEDGSRMKRVKIVAIGTPVPPAFTNGRGRYSMTLPQGAYTLQAAAGGCTETGFADVELFDGDVTQDFRLFRQLDDFGHGCRPIGFSWVDAKFNTGLFGDDFSGRLRLPFAFPFYGERYRQVFISDNGYVNFLEGDRFNSDPFEIPNPSSPNAAIYGLWQNLSVGEGGHIDYQKVGSAPHRAFVVEFYRVRADAADDPVTFEMKLWENGVIDLLYGNNTANPGDGRNALVGIENAEGTDALQFSFFEQLLGANEAYRFQLVPTGRVHGTVGDINDGQPIEGATITAQPGGRTTQTGSDGDYRLRLRPGSYTLFVSADLYRQTTRHVQIAYGGNLRADFLLRAPVAKVSPGEIQANVDFGEAAHSTLTISNTGTFGLQWTAKERDKGSQPPHLPRGKTRFVREKVWSRARALRKLPLTRIPRPRQPGFLSTIIEDPAGDAQGPVDVTTVRGGSDGSTVATVALDFTPSTPMSDVVGYVFFDTDQDPSTGLPPSDLAGKPTQDIGVDYFADLFSIHDPNPVVYIVDASTFEGIPVPVTIEGQTVSFDVPLEAVGGDDGTIDTAMVLGNFDQPTDWAPDVGHGTIEPFTDVPWLSERPESGGIRPGLSQDVEVSLGGPDLAPGEYHALIVLVTNAPKQRALTVDVTLTVAMPEEFGRVEGTVTDAHKTDPIEGVTVTLESQWQGEPLPITTHTAADGTYSLVGPEGTWRLTFAQDGYVTFERNVDITPGETAVGVDAAMHRMQPHATLDGGPFTFILTPGRQATGNLTLANADGHADLNFSTGEVPLGGPGTGADRIKAGKGHWLKRSQRAVRLRSNGGRTVRAHPVSYSWQASHRTRDFQILVYADDAIHTAPNTFVDQALQRLGPSYTAHYDGDFSGFESDLTAGGWDVVIFADDNFFPESSVLNALQAYVAGGGRLVFHGWTVGDDPSNPLWASLGFTWVSDAGDPPDPIHWWQPGSPAFLVPESVPEFTRLDGGIYRVYGQHIEPTADGEALAGYTTPGPDPNEAAMILGATRRTVFKGFLDGENSADLDNDGVPDGVELWTDLIFGIQTGFTSDVPWLTVQPAEGTVAKGGTTQINVTVDSTGLQPGLYQAEALVLTDDPDHRTFLVPVDLIVPAYQQGVNAGGSDFTDSKGDAYAADQAYSSGSFGYDGAGSTFSTSDPIGGTEDDPLYQDQRVGMTAYRFDVANGHYRVDLRFAELELNSAGARVFHVTIEDAPVLFNFDVFAAGGGQDVAVDRSFETDVTDGRLDIEFFGRIGEPIINAILVTELPSSGSGMQVR